MTPHSGKFGCGVSGTEMQAAPLPQPSLMSV